MIKQLESYISDKSKANLMLQAFGISKVPLIFFTGCKVKSIDNQQCQIAMPFARRNRNHLGSIYFGALAIGADTCIGLLAFHKIQQRGKKISLVFKSFHADFLKRAEGATTFVCEEGEIIDQLINECIESGERVHKNISAHAMVDNEIVATFTLELSLKLKA